MCVCVCVHVRFFANMYAGAFYFSARVFYASSFFFPLSVSYFSLILKRRASFLAPLSINERTIFFQFFFLMIDFSSIISIINASRDLFFFFPFHHPFILNSFIRVPRTLSHSFTHVPRVKLSSQSHLGNFFFSHCYSHHRSLTPIRPSFLSLVLSSCSYAQTLFRCLSRICFDISFYIYVYIYI